jgi:phospholipid/cholesterol/gamma-HCH transport system substrate-binding protein
MADLMQQASQGITLITDTVESVRGDAKKAMQEVALTAEDAHALVEDVRPNIISITRDGSRLAADAQQIAASIRDGKGTIGKLINDDGLYENAREIADKADTIVANMKEVSEEARRAISDFRSKDGPAQGLLADLRLTINQTREATADLADNMEAMKHNFFLRGFFNRRGYFDLNAISPAEYRRGVLENGKRKAMRIWLAANVLFEPAPDNTERLSADGRARLDSAMATYLKHVPTSPIVVEGYAKEGTIGEAYRIARHRAGIVREYVLLRYDLMPQNTGYIALGKEAQGSPNGGAWDGVSLALFLDRDALQFQNTSR